MGLLSNFKGFMSDYNKDKREFDKAKGFADLNKDGKLDRGDLDKARGYERTAQNLASKFHKR